MLLSPPDSPQGFLEARRQEGEKVRGSWLGTQVTQGMDIDRKAKSRKRQGRENKKTREQAQKDDAELAAERAGTVKFGHGSTFEPEGMNAQADWRSTPRVV